MAQNREGIVTQNAVRGTPYIIIPIPTPFCEISGWVKDCFPNVPYFAEYIDILSVGLHITLNFNLTPTPNFKIKYYWISLSDACKDMTPPCGAMDSETAAAAGPGTAPRVAKSALVPGQEFCMCSSLEVPSIAPPGVSYLMKVIGRGI